MAKIKTCKHIFKRLSLALVGLATICVAVGYAINTINKNIRDVNAEGGTTTAFIEVNPDGEGEPDYDDDYPYYYHYIDPETGLPWYTHRFFIEPEEGGGVNGFCAQPSVVDYPEGNVTGQVLPDTETNRLVKLMAYIASYDNSSNIALRSELFSWLPSDFRNTGGYYTYAHATIGYLFNNGDTTGLSDSDIANISGQNGVIAKLRSMINDNDNPYHNIWLTVQPYDLYGTVNDSGESIQTVVWVQEAEPEPEYGSITVHKCDAELEGATCNLSATRHYAQGGGSLAGITFTVYNDSGRTVYNPFDGNYYNDGQAMGTATTNANGIATFTNLPTGVDYNIAESAPNTGYLPTDVQAWVEGLTTNGATVSFSNNVIRGDVTFRKLDQDGNPMANVAFALVSATTGERHVVVTDSDGIVNTNNSYISHTTGTNGYDSITGGSYIHQNYGTWFNGVSPNSGLQGATANNNYGALPYDSYTLTELECNANELCDNVTSVTQSFSIATASTTVDLEDISNDCAEFGISTSATDAADGDKFVEASATASITDTINYCGKEGLTYTIQGVLMDKVTGEAVSTVQEATVTLPADSDCGTTTMAFTLDASELGGHDLVVFETLIYEGETVAEHKDLSDASQTVTVISLDTYALDKSDEDKEVLATADATVTDHIKYCLVAGTEYTIIGTLMNKNTGEPIVVKDVPIQSITTLTPVENCGDLYLDFDFDATGMGGTEIVVFEAAGITSPTPLVDDDICLEHDATDPDTCTSYFHELISHADLDDVSQTVLVTTPEPEPEPEPAKPADTGRFTSASNTNTGSSNAMVIVIASATVIGAGYMGFRLFSRKRFFGKK